MITALASSALPSLAPPATLAAALVPAWSGIVVNNDTTATGTPTSNFWATSESQGATYRIHDSTSKTSKFDATRYSTDGGTRGVDAVCYFDPTQDCFCSTLSPFATYPGIFAFTDGKVGRDTLDADKMKYVKTTSAGNYVYATSSDASDASSATFEVTAQGAPVSFELLQGSSRSYPHHRPGSFASGTPVHATSSTSIPS